MNNLKKNMSQLEMEFSNCNIYAYGSWVYSTQGPKSDFDFIIVGEGLITSSEERNFGDLHFYSLPDFKSKILESEISVLECLFLDENLKVQKIIIDFKVDLKILRDSCSKKSSNSWVKAKKKLLVEQEPYVAQKSLFHSLRILKFAIQIATHGRITNYNQKELWLEIQSLPLDWETWNLKYKPLYNELKSQFKRLSPKI